MITMGRRPRENAEGRYYVSDECDGCGICSDCAPANFELSADATYYYVIQQPYDEEEEQAMRAALEACPRHALRADGDD